MSNKNFYDEDEVIDSIVNEKAPNMTEEFERQQQQRQNNPFGSNVHVRQVGCGCFDGRKFITNFFIYTIVLMVTSGIFPGFALSGMMAAVQAGFILTLLNTFVKPILIFFTFPLTLMTLGLFYFVVNAIIILMTAGLMGYNFIISNFFVAFFAALFISFLQHLIKKHMLKVDQL